MTPKFNKQMQLFSATGDGTNLDFDYFCKSFRGNGMDCTAVMSWRLIINLKKH